MLGNPGFYANKKRKKPVLKQKKVSEGNEVVKSNPSKRHRDRLNGELDRLTDLLPFSGDVRSRLDKLSVLRLSVGYLRVKSYFRATINNNGSSLMFSGVNGQNGNSMDVSGFSEGDLLLQALNGFVMVTTADGSVFYVSSTIKDYLGFHQSDVVHQSVFELIHTDDRALFRQHLHFAMNPPSADSSGDGLQTSSVMYSPEQLPPENSSFLERSFVCRFRCLLDNSSGFLALKFQGRLKYLHGQRPFNGNGNKSQLALFAIAVPVQPPTIVEIRAKMLLFQTKHKLDFTPMAVDSRGKIILGYSETELCMKGSGYQFIHAADMMYCADNHMRMIKTGESGLTVFRLLSKSAGWLWVKANAKLIYKGGRPEFIIAYQRALVNAEGEEYLRQRRLQLPFSGTTGEGVLYDSGPTVDVSQFQFNKMFSSVDDMKKDVVPGSLLDCFMRQDEKAYMPTVEAPLPVDQVFMDSQALVSVGNDPWQEGGATTSTGDPAVVKEEAKQSVMTVIDDLKKMAEEGNFCTALQSLEVCDVELAEWESTLKRLNEEKEPQSSVGAELDSVLTNDIFDYIDSMLFKEKGEDCLDASPPSCLTASNNNQQDAFAQANQHLFQTQSPDCTYSPMNGVYGHQQRAMNGPAAAGQGFVRPAPALDGTQKLSHRGPLMPPADTSLPPLQQLQLQDIFSPSIELPELTVPDASPPFSVSHLGHPAQFPPCPHNNLRAPALANGHALPSSAQPGSLVPSVLDILPPLVPCKDFNSTAPPNIHAPYAASCLQGAAPFAAQQWPQSQQHRLQNGHELMPPCRGQTPGSLWPQGVAGLNHAQHEAAPQSSCMFEQHFSAGLAGGSVLSLYGTSVQNGAESLDQSPPQGSCYFQWGHSESVVGTSAVNQEDASASPPNVSSADLNMQHYVERHRQTQDDRAMCLTE